MHTLPTPAANYTGNGIGNGTHYTPTPPPPTGPHLPLVQLSGAGALLGRIHIAAPGSEPDTDELTAATTRRMRELAVEGAGHPVVVRAAMDAVVGSGVQDWDNQTAVVNAVWGWVRDRVQFVQDDDVLRAQLNLPDELELLIAPPLLVSMAAPAGDCDDFTMLTAAMLLAAGIPAVEIMTVAADGADPRRWSHVYLRARLNTGNVITVDCSHGPYIGWEAPQYYRRQGWGWFTAPAAALIEHRRVTRQKGAQMHGLAALPERPATPGSLPVAANPNARRAGLHTPPAWAWGAGGRVQNDPNFTSHVAGAVPGIVPRPTAPNVAVGVVPPLGAPVVSGVAGMGEFDWGAFATQATTGTFDVLKLAISKPGQYIQTAGSTISTQVPGAAPYPGGGVTVQTPIGSGTVGSGGMGGVVLLGALALGVVLLLKH